MKLKIFLIYPVYIGTSLLIPYVLCTYIQMYLYKHKILYSMPMISFVTKMVSMDMVVFSCPSLMKSLVVFERHSFSIELAGYIVKIRVPLPEFSYTASIRLLSFIVFCLIFQTSSDN